MNDREFKKRIQAIARGEEPGERGGQVLERERERPAKKQTVPKKPASKSKQSTPKLGQVRVRRKAS
jgi:hypothetical protein